MRLDKYLSHALVISRNNARKLIKNKQIKVNEKVILQTSYYINVDSDVVTLNNEKIDYQEFYYFMMNKPPGYISATTDNMHKTIIDLLSYEDQVRGVFPIGRLDIDTEGLIILTNNGLLTHNLTSPNKNIKKKYYVEVDGEITKNMVDIFKTGLIIKDGKDREYKTKEAQLEIIDTKKAYITITEGKFHQVKRMFEFCGLHVEYLKRVMIHNIYLDPKLTIGEYRPLTNKEIIDLTKDII